jgi:hypothetical protein
MFRMPRLILLVAAALAAAPSPARAQPGGAPAAQPARPVDECGKPATAARPRRGTARPASTGASAPAQPPRLLGAPVGEAAGSAAPGSHATAATPGADPQQPGHASAATAGTHSSHSSSTATSGAADPGHPASTATAGTHPSHSSTATSGAADPGDPASTVTEGTHPSHSSTAPSGAADPGHPASTATATAGGSNPQEGAHSTATAAGGATPQASSTSATVPQASGTSAQTGQSSTWAESAFLSAGDSLVDPRAARRNRDALRLGLDDLGDRMRLGPAASVSVPTAFGVDAGELFFGIAYQGRTRYTEDDDGAAVIGIGVGSRRVVALEAALTTYSTFRSNPLETGGVSVKLHRMLPRSTSVAVGYENAFLWGGSDDNGSLYAVATRMMNLRDDPEAPLSTAVFTLGVGNGRFRFEDDDAEDNETVNLFAAAGARVTPQISLVADWTGQDLNAAASLTPLLRVPVVITVGLADLTGSAGDGARFILSLGYGLAFRQMF